MMQRRINKVLIKSKSRSFKYKLIFSFVVVSIIPILLMQAIAYYNITSTMRENTKQLMNMNLIQTSKSLDATLSVYDNLLYQLYTNDDIVKLVEDVNKEKDIAVKFNQLRRLLHSFSNAKDGIKSITIITPNGKTIYYDKITASTLKSSWLDKGVYHKQDIYNKVSSTNNTTILPTQFAAELGGQRYYLFHIGHRIIDYMDINKDVGVIMISIDEEVINEVCNDNKRSAVNEKVSSVNFILDKENNMITFTDKDLIGKNINEYLDEKEETLDNRYIDLVKRTNKTDYESAIVNTLFDHVTGWTIVNVADQKYLFEKIYSQQRMTVVVGLLAIFVLIGIIIYITNRLSGSVGRVLNAMKIVEQGELSARVEVDDSIPQEILMIAVRFNKMISRLQELMEQVKAATFKQKEAEIRALEAQINPHFLYNTLDCINWMAIDHNEYEVSNMINSLAKILRYSIDKSNTMVYMHEEIDWLKQYIYLQQTRMKYTFEVEIDVDEEVLYCRIHKLLFQPFVENSIIHGFERIKRGGVLTVGVKDNDKNILVNLADNGKGMPQHTVNRLNSKLQSIENEDSHIGIENVKERLNMYYGSDADVKIESIEGIGTTVYIEIPKL
ncbi:MAG: yehU 12 [Clostridia bacterium]|jgi:two-component system sensor histidine kinase YesM|nr:yehU 12 [Clostridia bacterium]